MTKLCEVCKAAPATERPTLAVRLRLNVPLEDFALNTCEDCTALGFAYLVGKLKDLVADITRRRAISRLNQELKTLTDPEAIEANRKKKTALAHAKPREF